ncbi:response regulator protein [Salinisphaera shabanensis E1L3A]|uniref:Response regulator protein n=1 Tax=Salinisphaera shabanensis E1L3A TaxID=1033802 RepID=U2FUU6_9GAMM|nr:response regulator protein [Salinisphaera shabanensis E1L3A]
MDRVDVFITNLYQSIEHCRTDSFRETALQLLSSVIDFDGALWGCGNYTSCVFHSVATLGSSRATHARSNRPKPSIPCCRH